MFRTKSDAVKIGYDSIRIPARNGVSFTPENNQLVIDMTRNVGFCDLSNSYIEVDASIVLGADTPKHGFNKNCGILSTIRTQNIRSEGRLIEQLDHMNIYSNLHYLASADQGVVTKRERTELCMKDYQQVNNPWVARNEAKGAGAATTVAAPAITQKVALPLLGGLFTTSKAFPLMSAPLELELILAPASHALHIMDGMKDVGCEDLTNSGGTPADQTEFEISNSAAYGEVAEGNQVNMVANCPWRVGQKVRISHEVAGTAGADVETTISSIGIGTTKLKIVVAAGFSLAAGATADKIKISAFTAGGLVLGTAPSYKLDNPRLVVSKVIPPPAQVQAAARMMAKGQYTYNITTYTDFQNAIDANVVNSTNMIPADLTRVKSILSCPVLMDEVDSTGNDYALGARFDDAKEYQYQIANILRPDRRVDVQREKFGHYPAPAAPFSKPLYALGGRPAGLHLYEVEKALSAANIPVRNLRFLTNDPEDGTGFWLVGRSLGPYGLSENLNGVSTLLYLNYNSTHNANILLHNYVVHVRTIQISMSGVEVFN
tara:strand:+ start:306 stop:1943 length:1638 start_codon:yes stop_codon:yes gene_type:complete